MTSGEAMSSEGNAKLSRLNYWLCQPPIVRVIFHFSVLVFESHPFEETEV